MDQQKLRTLVFEKTGIRIDTTDPVFALVALNESVLEETLQRHLGLLRDHASSQWHGAATLQPAGTRQPAFKAAGDNFEAEDELPRSAEPVRNTALASADEPDNALVNNGGDAATNSTAEAARSAMPNDAGALRSPASGTLALPWDARLLWLALAMSLATALLVLGGQAWLQPKPGPATLSLEQKALLQRAEKLNKAMEKLDAKARAQLQAELDKL